MKFLNRTLQNRKATALIIVLFAVAILTIMAVTLLVFARTERTASNLALRAAESRTLSDLAADAAIARLKEATEAGMQRGKLWASEPGRIRVFDAATMNFQDYDLFSALPGADSSEDLNNIDLNRPSFEGNYPIATPAQAGVGGEMRVGWINFLADPNNAASKSNPVIGRVAYWVDDESCKININVADGTQKDTNKSFGFGTPSEISLEALGLPREICEQISAYAWSQGFNSAAEIGRVSGMPAGFYETNKYNITNYSKTPEISFTGEPRIYLFPVARVGTGANVKVASLLSKGYGVVPGKAGGYLQYDQTKIGNITDAIDFVYPTSSQIEAGNAALAPFYQYGRDFYPAKASVFKPGGGAENYAFATRIAKAIKGIDALGNAFQWPVFGSASSDGFAGKYNDRQIDSLALQILDLGTRSAMVDVGSLATAPSLTTHGMLSGKNAIGLGRTPKFTELSISFDGLRDKVPPVTHTEKDAAGKTVTITDVPGTDNIPIVMAEMAMEFYFPEGYQGTGFGSILGWWRGGNLTNSAKLAGYSANRPDAALGITEPGLLRDQSYWHDNLFSIYGIDLGRASYLTEDKDPRAAIYHSYMKDKDGKYRGGNYINAAGRYPLFNISNNTFGAGEPSSPAPVWDPGEYRSIKGSTSPAYKMYGPNEPLLAALEVKGGIAFCSQVNNDLTNWEAVPLDGLRGDYSSNYGETYTEEDPKSILAELQQQVIPVPPNFSIAIGKFGQGAIVTDWHAYVVDPLVNKFPGDWIVAADDNARTMDIASGVNAKRYDAATGANPGFKGADGGDPLSLWMPRIDNTYPKQSRFPSVGALNYIRTGVVPDDLTGAPATLKGTPWRSLALTPASDAGQMTAKGRYPDWAMLDLFTVPFLPQLAYVDGFAATPKRKLTYGGATEGKLNINNPGIPYPFSKPVAGVSQSPPPRTAPLEALFRNLRLSTTYTGASPVYTTIDATGAAAFRQAVQAYVADGPLALPGQLAEVPGMNDYTYAGVPEKARSRNDLIRQVVGATTTQSNVFSIWVVAQTVRKKTTNTGYGAFESGDAVTGETRRRYVVERFIDLGKDGVPGNAKNPGPDNIIGTEDDPIDPIYHPAMTFPLPYRWRIVSVEEFSS